MKPFLHGIKMWLIFWNLTAYANFAKPYHLWKYSSLIRKIFNTTYHPWQPLSHGFLAAYKVVPPLKTKVERKKLLHGKNEVGLLCLHWNNQLFVSMMTAFMQTSPKMGPHNTVVRTPVCMRGARCECLCVVSTSVHARGGVWLCGVCRTSVHSRRWSVWMRACVYVWVCVVCVLRLKWIHRVPGYPLSILWRTSNYTVLALN